MELKEESGLIREQIWAEELAAAKGRINRHNLERRFGSNSNVSFFKANVYRHFAPIDVGLSPLKNYWTTFCETAFGLIRARPMRTS
jgi:hypothetical protein